MLLIHLGLFFMGKPLCDLKLSEREGKIRNARPKLTKLMAVNWDVLKSFSESNNYSVVILSVCAGPTCPVSGRLGVN